LAASKELEKEPAGQSMQAVAIPWFWKRPGSHEVQLVEPGMAEKRPVGQSLHWTWPVASEKLPAPHSSQLREAREGAKVPAGQGVQPVRRTPWPKEPAGQGLGAVAAAGAPPELARSCMVMTQHDRVSRTRGRKVRGARFEHDLSTSYLHRLELGGNALQPSDDLLHGARHSVFVQANDC